MNKGSFSVSLSYRVCSTNRVSFRWAQSTVAVCQSRELENITWELLYRDRDRDRSRFNGVRQLPDFHVCRGYILPHSPADNHVGAHLQLLAGWLWISLASLVLVLDHRQGRPATPGGRVADCQLPPYSLSPGYYTRPFA